MDSQDNALALVDSQFNETPAELLTDESDAMRMKQVGVFCQTDVTFQLVLCD